jgi:hypothetical protein
MRMSINDYADSCQVAAREALVRAKAITGCRFHSGVTIRVGDEAAERHAYALATNVMKKDGTIAFMREDVLSAIKYELEQAEHECPHCGRED